MEKRAAFAVLATGFSGLAAQVLLLREILVVFAGNELSIGLILANWLIIEAAGCLAARRRVKGAASGREAFAGLALAFSLALPAAVWFARVLRNVLGLPIAAGAGLPVILLASFLVLLPVSFFHGALFTWGCKLFLPFSGQRAAGRVYVFETIGTLAGGAAWMWLAASRFHAFDIAFGLAALNFLAAALLLGGQSPGAARRRKAAAAAALLSAAALAIIFSGAAERLHRRSLAAQWKEQNVAHYQNSIYGNITVIESGGQHTFFLDGRPGFASPVAELAGAEEFVHLPLLSHPDPRRVLVLGGGAGGTISEILKHPPVSLVEYIELDPLLTALLRKYPSPLVEEELADPRVRVRQVDGRRFLALSRAEYDLVMVGLDGPSDLRSNRFYTGEFFALARARMTGAGILVLRLPGSLAYLDDELRDLNGCVRNTLSDVFAHVRMIPGDGANIFIASDSPAVSALDRSSLLDRLEKRGVGAGTPMPWRIEQKLHPGWQEWVSGFLAEGTREVNRDFRPRALFYSVSHWNAVFVPRLRGVFRLASRLNTWFFGGVFFLPAVLYLLVRASGKKISGPGVSLCVFTSGFAGMVFDLALIFAFQSVYGYVFRWIGLLAAFFMAGAAGGATAMTSFLPRVGNARRVFTVIDGAVACFALLLSLFFLAPGLFPALSAASPFPRVFFPVAAAAGGALIGAQFPLANRVRIESGAGPEGTGGLLYGADLAGGWLGGVAGGAFLLPVLGLPGTFLVIAMFKLAAGAVFAGQPRGAGRVRTAGADP